MLKYGKAKQILDSAGFQLKYLQTGASLHVLTFENPKISGSINLSFDYNCEIPEDVEEIDYDLDAWLMDINVSSISLDIDVGIDYMSPNVLSVYNSGENSIYLCGEYLSMFEDVMGIVTDPYAILNFQEQYNHHLQKFFDGVKRFIPVMEKHGFSHRVYKTGQTDHSLYSNLSLRFEFNDISYVSFEFDVLSWERAVYICITKVHDIQESATFSFDCNLEDFEKELDKQVVERTAYLKWQSETYKDTFKNSIIAKV